jgi:cadmium resistance protein CadD (predicted permease)
VIETIGFALALFVATNIDAIVVLAMLFADPRLRKRDVWLGQLAGNIAVIAISAAGSLLSGVVRHEFLGVLGVVPFVLGVTQLLDRSDDDDDDGERSYGNRVVGVALVMFANGGDNIGAYVPAFATRSPSDVALTIAVFLVMLVAWCWLCSQLRVGPRLRRVTKLVTPLVFMALGVLIFVESGALRLVLK